MLSKVVVVLEGILLIYMSIIIYPFFVLSLNTYFHMHETINVMLILIGGDNENE